MDVQAIALDAANMASTGNRCCGVLLYGSRSDNTAIDGSDLDLMVVVEEQLEQHNLIYRHPEVLVHMQLLGQARLAQICVPLAKNYVPEIVCYGTILSDPASVFAQIRSRFQEDVLYYRRHHILEHYEGLCAAASRLRKCLITDVHNIFDTFECLKQRTYLEMCFQPNPIRRCHFDAERYEREYAGKGGANRVFEEVQATMRNRGPAVLSIISEVISAHGERDCYRIEQLLSQRLRNSFLALDSQGLITLNNGPLPRSMQITLSR